MNISYEIFDSELGYTAFTVERITYTRTQFGTSVTPHMFPVQGCVHPGTPDMLKLLPEEERNETFIVIYTDFALSTGTPEDAGASSFTAPDRIHWDGRTWRVVKVRDWKGFGYCQALAVLMQEGEAV